jgi:hypothetical protein
MSKDLYVTVTLTLRYRSGPDHVDETHAANWLGQYEGGRLPADVMVCPIHGRPLNCDCDLDESNTTIFDLFVEEVEYPV